MQEARADGARGALGGHQISRIRSDSDVHHASWTSVHLLMNTYLKMSTAILKSTRSSRIQNLQTMFGLQALRGLARQSGQTGSLTNLVLRCMATGAAAKAASPPPPTKGSSGSGSGKSPESQLPTAPLQLSGTSASIATLTWQCALKEKALEQVQDELGQLAEAFNNLPELRRLATDPFVPAEVRKKVVHSILKDSKASQLTKNLLDALADENALAAVPAVSAAYDELQLAYKKEVYVTIVTAHPLDKMEREEVRKQAEKFVEPGFKLVAKEKVDPKLLGGFVLEFEDRLVDLSTSKKVSEFNALVTKLENDLK